MANGFLPDPMRRRLRRAAADTRWFSVGKDIAPSLVVGLAGALATWWVARSQNEPFSVKDALFVVGVGFAALVVYFVLSNCVEFAWNFAVAGYKNARDDALAAAGSPTAPALTVYDMMDFYNDRTALQADAVIRPYLGQSFTVTGTLFEVHDSFIALRHRKGGMIFCFLAGSTSNLHWLNPKDQVTVRGNLRRASRFDVYLEECEISGRS